MRKKELNTYVRLNPEEVRRLLIGDKVAIDIKNGDKTEYMDTVITCPLNWHPSLEKTEWDIETAYGFVNIYSIHMKYGDYIQKFHKD